MAPLLDIICAVLQIGRSPIRLQMVSLEYFIDIKPFRSYYGPGVDSASNRNEYQEYFLGVELDWNLMAHGDAREGKWRGNWRIEWVASTLHTTSEHGVSSITTADAHTSAASSRLKRPPSPPADLSGLVCFAERPNLVSARLPSHFKCALKAANA